MITKKAKEKQDVKFSCQEICRERQDSIIRASSSEGKGEDGSKQGGGGGVKEGRIEVTGNHRGSHRELCDPRSMRGDGNNMKGRQQRGWEGTAYKHQAGATAEGCAKRVRSKLSLEREQDRKEIAELSAGRKGLALQLEEGTCYYRT